jgi:hypothetical protein
MVAAKCSTCDSPAELTKLTGQDGFADFVVGRPEHLSRGCDDIDTLGGGTCDEVSCLTAGHRHGFIEVDMLASLDRLNALIVVQANRRADDNGIDGWISKDFIFSTVGVWNAVFCSGCIGTAIHWVTACSDMCDALHVLKDEVVQGSTDSN